MSAEKVLLKLKQLRQEYDDVQDKMFPLLDKCPNWDEDDDEGDNFNGNILSDEELDYCRSLLEKWRELAELINDPILISGLSKADVEAYDRYQRDGRNNNIEKEMKKHILNYLEKYDERERSLLSEVNIHCKPHVFYEALDEWLKSRIQRLY